jgi:L-amino acid N-acyltransferase YncA
MGEVVIRELIAEDYDAVRRVDAATQRQYRGATWDQLPDADKEEHLVSRRSDFAINLSTGYCFVASIDGEIVAFLFAYEALPFGKDITITYIGVSPAYQGQEIGVRLYRTLIAKATSNGMKMITALINLDNPPSMALHQKVGFVLHDRKEATLKLM